MRVLAFLAGLSAAPALACAPDPDALALTPEATASLVAYATLAPGRLSQPFEMQLVFCGEDAPAIQRVEVSAIMPAHQHGMNYEPVVTALDDGRFSVSGMVFHMPGSWQVQVAAFGDGEPVFYTLEVEAR
ncbi:FixH family protein [Bauldia litoralis]|uniref:YtkA-like n=1 Tax=Bauldia litoralis TaxID=665467 RepID=A0A1G6DK69_9HYPH|nr:FixH family protein [Bauldia litoralis]SDB45532.1 YtkA-like [Bauldia litoralis]